MASAFSSEDNESGVRSGVVVVVVVVVDLLDLDFHFEVVVDLLDLDFRLVMD